MRHRSSLVALLSAVLMAAGGLIGCDQEPGTTSGDPRVEGVLPHPLPAADTSILAAPPGAKRTTTPTPARPTPAESQPATSPTTNPEGPGGPETSPATAPSTATAPA